MMSGNLGSANTGRLEFLRDGTGIYGLIGERPARWRHETTRLFRCLKCRQKLHE